MNPVVGVRDLVAAKLTTDSKTALTYEAVVEIEGLMGVELPDNSGEAKPYYADDVEKGRITSQAKLGVTLEILAAEKATIAKFYGHTVGENGVVVKKDGDKPPYFAIGFKAATEGENGGDDGMWLPKCIATKRTNSRTYRTIEGETKTIQTVKIELEAIPTVYDGNYEHLANSQDTGMTTAWATWFSKVPGSTTG